MEEKLKKIYQINSELEKQTPYNFCDRWCERCPLETRMRCSLYMDDVDRQVTNIAHGRDPDDLEIFEEDLQDQFNSLKEHIEPWMEEIDIADDEGFELDQSDEDGWEKMQQRHQQVRILPLLKVVQQYSHKTHEFLKANYYYKNGMNAETKFEFEPLSWYHTLLPAKMYRALCGLADYNADGNEMELCDTIAQFEISKKSIQDSAFAAVSLDPDYIFVISFDADISYKFAWTLLPEKIMRNRAVTVDIHIYFLNKVIVHIPRNMVHLDM